MLFAIEFKIHFLNRVLSILYYLCKVTKSRSDPVMGHVLITFYVSGFGQIIYDSTRFKSAKKP